MAEVVGVVAERVDMHIFGAEISFRLAQMVCKDTGAGVLACDGKAVFYYKGIRYLRRKVAEGILIMSNISVDVEMVGIHSSNDGNGGVKL